ncbi:hypothetical protein FMM75_01940 [Lachnospiraceae bacterium MD335]|nr:hypothetical protein [Lachnospiraceae bacterium MD335]
MYNFNVKNIEQLALLGYNLQCMERPVAMVLESYKKNSMLYILLFREIESIYFNGNLMEFIAEKVGITTKDIFVDKQNVKDYIKENVIQNKKMIFFFLITFGIKIIRHIIKKSIMDTQSCLRHSII